MVTKEQAIKAGEAMGRTEFHYGNCKKIIGPRGGITYKIEVWRSNGKCKVWKTRPNEFSLPVKYGFNGPYGYITEITGDVHLASECPILLKDALENAEQDACIESSIEKL